MSSEEKREKIVERLSYVLDKRGIEHRIFEDHDEDVCSVSELIGEKKYLIAANWNQWKRENRLQDVLEENDILMGYLDEYVGCSQCGKAIRVIPESYDWQPKYIILDLEDCPEYICEDCVRDSIQIQEEMIEEYQEKTALDQFRALPNWTKLILKRHGFKRYGGGDASPFHSGWYRYNDPEQVDKDIPSTMERLFIINLEEQFSTNWEVFVR